MDGLAAPVRVVRDRWGVPHIHAQNQRDLFVAQGFVQAQDRLFQMDLWRRAAQGRLSEVLGLNFVERDAATRRIQYRGDPSAEWASYGPDAKAIAEAFVAGVNVRVAEARTHAPEEFVAAGWLPEPWRAEDLLNRTDAFVASAADADVFRARLVAAMGERRADAWFPGPSPYRVAPGLEIEAVNAVVQDALRRAGTPPFFLGLASPIVDAPAAGGSNAWAVSGARSASGAPLLAADPHRAFANPSLRYLVHLVAPGWNVIGAASPWLPGVVIGHNDRVAWGMTAFPADVADVFVEHVNPANPHQVRLRDRWVDTTIVRDPIAMKGQAKPFPFEREHTPNGVVVATDSQRHLAFALRWSGSEPGAAGELAALALDRAQNAGDVRSALARWKLPAVEVVYATADGVTGRQVAALVPDRRGWDGALPVPGWSGAFEWRGWRSLDDLPHAQTPRAGGVVVSANLDPARTMRLTDLLGGEKAFAVDDFRRAQLDTVAWKAGRLIPLLASLRANRADADDARQQLMGWDRRVSAASTAATLYVFWEDALERVLAARLPSALADDFRSRAAIAVQALTKPSALWFDGDPLAARDRVLLEALDAAVDRVRDARAGSPQAPAWGSLHTLLFRHPLAISPAARRRFNVGPFALAGYAGTVLSTSPAQDVAIGPAFREIVDVAAWDRSLWINAPGQSGSPAGSHYADLAKPWASGDYFQMAFSDEAVRAVAQSELTLQPK